MFLEIKLEEDDGYSLVQSDAIDEYQYLHSFRAGAADEPEMRLMRAVLEDALRCLKKYAPIRNRRGLRLFRETEGWLLADTEGWVFSFGNVCAALGLNPAYVRSRVLGWKEHRLSVRPITSTKPRCQEAQSTSGKFSKRGLRPKSLMARKDRFYSGKRSLAGQDRRIVERVAS